MTTKQTFINGIDEIIKNANLNFLHELLEVKFLEIEKNNADFFLKRKSSFNPLDHDRLKEHLFLMEDRRMVQFGFSINSELPYHIESECIKAFKQVYS